MLVRKRQIASVMKGGHPQYTMFMTLKEGLQVLTDTIRDSLRGTELKLNIEITSLVRNLDGFKLRSDSGSYGPYDAVIIASPSYGASRILRETDQTLSAPMDKRPDVSTPTVSMA